MKLSFFAAGAGLSLALALSAYAADLEKATVATVKQGTIQPNGASCLYVTAFISSEVSAPFLKYTLAVGKAAGDLVSAMIVTQHRTINFDFGPANSQCQEFDGFAGALSILRPGAP